MLTDEIFIFAFYLIFSLTFRNLFMYIFYLFIYLFMFALRQICLFKKRCTISVESVSER